MLKNHVFRVNAIHSVRLELVHRLVVHAHAKKDSQAGNALNVLRDTEVKIAQNVHVIHVVRCQAVNVKLIVNVR